MLKINYNQHHNNVILSAWWGGGDFSWRKVSAHISLTRRFIKYHRDGLEPKENPVWQTRIFTSFLPKYVPNLFILKHFKQFVSLMKCSFLSHTTLKGQYFATRCYCDQCDLDVWLDRFVSQPTQWTVANVADLSIIHLSGHAPLWCH